MLKIRKAEMLKSINQRNEKQRGKAHSKGMSEPPKTTTLQLKTEDFFGGSLTCEYNISRFRENLIEYLRSIWEQEHDPTQAPDPDALAQLVATIEADFIQKLSDALTLDLNLSLLQAMYASLPAKPSPAAQKILETLLKEHKSFIHAGFGNRKAMNKTQRKAELDKAERALIAANTQKWSLATLARELGMSRQNLNDKWMRDPDIRDYVQEIIKRNSVT